MAVQKTVRRRAPHTPVRKEKTRETILARSAWMNETAHLREAVDNDDERLAVLLVRNIIRDRRRESAA